MRLGGPGGLLVDPGQLAFEGGKERLDRSALIAAADGAKRVIEFESGHSAGERQRGVDGAADALLFVKRWWPSPPPVMVCRWSARSRSFPGGVLHPDRACAPTGLAAVEEPAGV